MPRIEQIDLLCITAGPGCDGEPEAVARVERPVGTPDA
jgi:hypothetical protein